MSGQALRPIPNEKMITSFFHCGDCMREKPSGISPRDWALVEAGFTDLGIQVWCKRHEANIMHIDFQGQCHPANLTRLAPKDRLRKVEDEPN